MRTISERVRDLMTHQSVVENDEAIIRYVTELAYEYDRTEGETLFNKELDDLLVQLGHEDETQSHEERGAVGPARLIPARDLVKYLV